jgi:hypothetical protein
MVDAIKKELGIKSPSKVMFEVGKFVSMGAADGVEAYAHEVEDSAELMGKKAVLAMQKSIEGMAELIRGDMDINPTITPVLDLTQVRKTAAGMPGMLATKPIHATTTYAQARNASAGYWDSREIGKDDRSEPMAPSVTNYNQYNNSPKALSTAEIYRQTKNQLSKTKGAQTTDANARRVP